MSMFSWFPRISFERRESNAGSLISFSMVGRPKWTPRSYEKLADEGFEKNIVAYRCISMISIAAATVPLLLFKGETEVENHPLLELLDRPNPLQGQVGLFESLYAYFLIAGNTYLEAAMPKGKLPTELWTLRPDRMKVIPGSGGIPAAYRYTVGSQHTDWKVNAMNGTSPIMHMRGFHPTDDWYGFSPIEAAGWSIDQHNAASSWNKALLDNSGRPSGALVYAPKEGDETLSAEKFARLKTQLDEKYSSPRNAGKPMILDGGLDWKEMALSPKDMDWLKGKDVSSREIALAFGVPGQLVGIPGQQTYANNREARLALYEDTILPLVLRTLAQINNWLVPIFGPELELRADIDEIPALVLRRERVWDRVQSSDFLTVNEKRMAVGYDDAGPDGDVILVGASLIPLEQAVAEPAPIPDALDPNTPGGINPGEPDDDDDPDADPDELDENEKAALLAYGIDQRRQPVKAKAYWRRSSD